MMNKIAWFGAAFVTSLSVGKLAIAAKTGAAANDASHTRHELSNDLLTAGLGASGLGSPAVPAITNPAAPTVEELRRLAIYNNYRALIDPTANGGYGTLYGPTVPPP